MRILVEDEHLERTKVDAGGQRLSGEILTQAKDQLPREEGVPPPLPELYFSPKAQIDPQSRTGPNRIDGTDIKETAWLPDDTALLLEPDNVCFYFEETGPESFEIYAGLRQPEQAVKIVNIATEGAD